MSAAQPPWSACSLLPLLSRQPAAVSEVRGHPSTEGCPPELGEVLIYREIREWTRNLNSRESKPQNTRNTRKEDGLACWQLHPSPPSCLSNFASFAFFAVRKKSPKPSPEPDFW